MINFINLLAAHYEVEFEEIFNGFGLISIITYIFSSIVPILIIVFVIRAIVKASKNKNSSTNEESIPENNTIDLEDISESTICNYCGSNNDKSSIKCSGCGAPLNHNKKR